MHTAGFVTAAIDLSMPQEKSPTPAVNREKNRGRTGTDGLHASMRDRLIGQRKKILADLRVKRICPPDLKQKGCCQALLRVHDPGRPKGSRPAKGADTWPEPDTLGSDRDPIAKPPVAPHPGSIHIVAINLKKGMGMLLRGEIVGRHRLYSLARAEP